MNRSTSLAVLVAGILLVVFGVSAARSLPSGISQVFTGFPTEKSMWMLSGGAILCVIGISGLGRVSR